jgi:succinoglycan biosynthesis protein ExoA
MTTPCVSVVLPCRNEIQFIDDCLASVYDFEPVEGGFEVIVVDGNSTDGTQEKLAAWQTRHPDLRVLDNPRGIVPTAMNIGIRAARGELLIRLDAHSTYARDYLCRCVATAHQTAADNVGGIMVTMPRGKTPGARLVRALTTHRFGVGDSEFRLGSTEGPADTVPYGCFPRSVFEWAGFYDERLVRNQDYELNCRIRRLGGVVWMNPAIAISYYNQATLHGLLKQAITTSAWNAWMWYLAPYSFTVRHAIPGLFVAALLGAAVLSLVSLQGLTVLGAILLPYTILALAASVQQASRYAWWLILPLPFCFFAYHFMYGLGTLWGELRLLFHTSPVQQRREPWPGAGRYCALPKLQHEKTL